VLFTLMVLALYRLGSWIPAPGVDSQTIKDYFNGRGGTILGLLNVFSGGALSQFALFALGIMPYVTASIILQLMTVVVPQLEQLQKEGESGYAKINQYTRYLTVGLAAAQSTGYAYLFKRAGNLQADTGRIVLIVVTLTAGTTLLMWLGELITTRVNTVGVSPVIFAAAVMAFPPPIAQFFPPTQGFSKSHFSYSSLPYLLMEGILIVVFTYFYTAVQFNPVDQADNLRKYGGYIPGIRPGPPTAQYFDRVLTRLTLPGSIYLATVAVLPSIFIRYGGFSQANSRALGGTSVLIVVGVALDTMRQMESQMMMRSYEGFLK